MNSGECKLKIVELKPCFQLEGVGANQIYSKRKRNQPTRVLTEIIRTNKKVEHEVRNPFPMVLSQFDIQLIPQKRDLLRNYWDTRLHVQ